MDLKELMNLLKIHGKKPHLETVCWQIPIPGGSFCTPAQRGVFS
jgi:hypothetical protein